MNQNFFSSATPEEDVVTSRGIVCTSSLILGWLFSVTFSSSLEKQSAVVLTEPAICAILEINCNTNLHEVRKNDGKAFV